MMANEKRLIDANEAIRISKEDKLMWVYDLTDLEDFLADVPTVDAVEVVHARWVPSGQCNHKPYRIRNTDKWTVYKCSECGYSNGRKFNANYCPNCGAKMDGERKDNG